MALKITFVNWIRGGVGWWIDKNRCRCPNTEALFFKIGLTLGLFGLSRLIRNSWLISRQSNIIRVSLYRPVSNPLTLPRPGTGSRSVKP